LRTPYEGVKSAAADLRSGARGCPGIVEQEGAVDAGRGLFDPLLRRVEAGCDR
jgi:hypothetical protein